MPCSFSPRDEKRSVGFLAVGNDVWFSFVLKIPKSQSPLRRNQKSLGSSRSPCFWRKMKSEKSHWHGSVLTANGHAPASYYGLWLLC